MYRLPFGGSTDNVETYTTEWMKIAQPLSEVLEMSIYGFNPMITLNTGVSLFPTVSFSPEKAKFIVDKFNRKEA